MLEGRDGGGGALTGKQVIDSLGSDGSNRGGTYPFGRTDRGWYTASSDDHKAANQGITADHRHEQDIVPRFQGKWGESGHLTITCMGGDPLLMERTCTQSAEIIGNFRIDLGDKCQKTVIVPADDRNGPDGR